MYFSSNYNFSDSFSEAVGNNQYNNNDFTRSEGNGFPEAALCYFKIGEAAGRSSGATSVLSFLFLQYRKYSSTDFTTVVMEML